MRCYNCKKQHSFRDCKEPGADAFRLKLAKKRAAKKGPGSSATSSKPEVKLDASMLRYQAFLALEKKFALVDGESSSSSDGPNCSHVSCQFESHNLPFEPFAGFSTDGCCGDPDCDCEPLPASSDGSLPNLVDVGASSMPGLVSSEDCETMPALSDDSLRLSESFISVDASDAYHHIPVLVETYDRVAASAAEPRVDSDDEPPPR
jgi:hypothetical protein